MKSYALLALLFQWIASTLYSAESTLGSWTNWRGPNYNGSQAEEVSLPEKFGPDKGVKWKCTLPGSSAATPIIDAKRVFLSSVDLGSGSGNSMGGLVALCVDRFTGKVLWQKNAGSGYLPGGDGFTHQLDSKSNYASPSPVTDGKRVIFFFGNGDLVAYSVKGAEEWRRNIQRDYGNFCFQWTFSSSPTLHGNRLYLPILQRNEPVHGRGKPNAESFLLCMDPKTGKTLWKKNRDSSARKESLESFGTIIPHKGQLLVAGGDVITGHDPKSGDELWRWGTWNPGHKQEWWRLVPSPVVGGGRILVCAPKKAPVYAIETGLSGTHSGKVGLAWSTENQTVLTSDVPTPLYYREKFFVLSDLRKVLSRVQPKSGKVEWSLDLPGKYKWRSSPTGGDGKIFLMNHNGEVLVVTSESGKILTHAKMGDSYDDNTRSSVALAGNNLFIRTNEILYCIE